MSAEVLRGYLDLRHGVNCYNSDTIISVVVYSEPSG